MKSCGLENKKFYEIVVFWWKKGAKLYKVNHQNYLFIQAGLIHLKTKQAKNFPR